MTTRRPLIRFQFAHPKKRRRVAVATLAFQHEDRSRYMPHQGEREMARRRSRISK